MCNRGDDWLPASCDTDYVKEGCPAMCGQCRADPDAEKGLCPPVYGPSADTNYDDDDDDDDTAQTMYIKSHQSTILFVMAIITFIINGYDVL